MDIFVIRRRREVIPVICIADPNGSGYDILRPIKPTMPSPTPPTPKPVRVERDYMSNREAGIVFRTLPMMRPVDLVIVCGSFEHRKRHTNRSCFPDEATCWKEYGRRTDQHYR